MARPLWTSDALIEHVKATEFRHVDDIVHVFVGRSELHGAKIHGTDDLDIYGVFVGFADNQLKRMTGELGRGKKGQRPEIEERFGYDVKAAMHTIRLLYECIELLRDKKITLPRTEKELLNRVRTGEFSIHRMLAMAQELFQECRTAEQESGLPATVDRDAVSNLMAAAYLAHWRPRATASFDIIFPVLTFRA
jgi:hypothetical protein